MATQSPPNTIAVVTGASTGIGYDLAECCAKDGFDVVIAADESEIEDAAEALRRHGTNVTAVEADLSTEAGVDKLIAAIGTRSVGALLANAGRGLGEAFLDQDWEEARRVVDTNITGTIYIIQKIGQRMRDQGSGRILITGSIAGFMPGSFQAVYNGTKAFLDSFAIALRNELKESGVTVTCLMPGATETEFFDRAHMEDTKVGAEKKDDPADVARAGYNAMMEGEADIITGWKNKLQVAASRFVPATRLAEQHRKMAAPGTAKNA
jgi:short-subunit dehydrogenase